ncbi:right-handed parallel beta-helix repeat-containing protein, partial [Candidatus Woesearchaeota archaeon]|nr:right-handed parallel beta-helix repeat-containing protein [Candidatus Woesearchaeota archaeon]
TNETAWSLKQANISTIINNTLFGINNTFAADGVYLWNIYCCDNSSNCAFNDTNYTIKVDSTAPVINDSLHAVNVTLLMNQSYVKLNVSINESNVDTVYFDIDGTNYSATDNNPEFYYEWKCNVSGTYYWNMTFVNDSAENSDSNLSVGLSWECDANKSVVSGEAVNDTAIYLDEYFCANATVTDSEGNLNSSFVFATIWNTTHFVNYTMSNASGGCGGAGENVFSIAVKANATGTWNYSVVYAKDFAGNIEEYDFTDLEVVVSAAPCPCTDCSSCESQLNNASCRVIQLTQSISGHSGTCINNPADFGNKTFDCLGNTIDGDSSGTDYGIYLVSQQNNTIRNCKITDFYYGIYLDRSSNNNISNLTIQENLPYDVYVRTTSESHCDNLLENITGSGGRPIEYYNSSVNLQDKTLSELILCDTDGSDIKNITINSSLTKQNNMMFVLRTDNSNITGIVSSANHYGVYLESSDNNNLVNITGYNNSISGIYLDSSDSNNITNATVNDNEMYGIYLDSSDSNILTNITAYSNEDYGIRLSSAELNTITNCTSQENLLYDLYVYATSESHCRNIIESVTGSGGRPIEYYNSSVNVQNKTLSELVLCNADSANINNITINGSSTEKNNGLLVLLTDHSNITNIASSQNYRGVYLLTASTFNSFINITTNNNDIHGLIILSSDSNNFTNITANDNGQTGVRIQTSSSNIFRNITTYSNDNYGIHISNSADSNTFTNVHTYSNGNDGIYMVSSSNSNSFDYITSHNNVNYGINIYTSSDSNIYRNNRLYSNEEGEITIHGNSISNEFVNLSVGSNYPTNVSFIYASETYTGSITLTEISTPQADPLGYHNISKYINITNSSGPKWVFLNVSYTDSDISSISESTLKIWKYNGTGWQEDGWNMTRVLDTTNNVVGVNITSFSAFAPMGFAYYITPTAPADGSVIDRDSVNASASDTQTLTAVLSNGTSGVSVRFYANLTDPSIAGQANINLSANVTDASGIAVLEWNGTNATSDKMYAGNYTWWAEAEGYMLNGSKFAYLYMGLNLTFRYASQDPNETYIVGDVIMIDELLHSYGPETDSQVNATYNANVNATLTDPSGDNFSVELVDPDIEETGIQEKKEGLFGFISELFR